MLRDFAFGEGKFVSFEVAGVVRALCTPANEGVSVTAVVWDAYFVLI